MTITERMEPITDRYDRIIALLENNPGEKTDRYREELLGSSLEIVSPDIYNMIGYGTELVGSYPKFKAMLHDPYQIRDAAKMIAQTRLQNMIELVQRHERLQKEKRDKLARKVGKKT